MVEVKIPKIINIQKNYLYEHLEQFLRDVVLKVIKGEIPNRSIYNVCNLGLTYFSDALGLDGLKYYILKKYYEQYMGDGKTRFKDSRFKGHDYIIFSDSIAAFATCIQKHFDEINIISPELSPHDKIKLIYERMTREFNDEING